MTKYPLLEVLEVKKRRVDEAEKVVREKMAALQKEKDLLAQREADRDKVLHHKNKKLNQLRETLDKGTTSPKIDQMKKYLEVVKEKLKIEEKKVKDQQQQVDVATKNLEVAKDELRRKRKDVDKIESHKKEWLKEARKEMELKEAIEQDEMGSILFMAHLRRE